MITNDNKLEILENFRTDQKLPKYVKQREVYRMKMSEDTEAFGDEAGFHIGSMSMDRSMVIHGSSGSINVSVPPKGFWPWFWSLFARKANPKPKLPTITIEEFFSAVKNSAKELETVQNRAAGYEQAMERARQAGQTALLEKLQHGLEVYRNESQLLALDSRRYLTEADLVRFVKEAKKGLRLDWVGNFTRMIPVDILQRKIRMDELGVFDNYAVLHYDPDKKSWAETQADIARRLDPILFGVMVSSRNLYFVGDWVDAQCDLTLEQIVDTLGSDVVKEIETKPL